MFGYIKPDRDNLLVKDLTLYKAVYCGLCTTIRKNVSIILPLKLSYDFVFLTMMREAITEEKQVMIKGRCNYNPFKKVAYSIPKESALFTANSALILTTLNIKDDLSDSDTHLFKKAVLFPLYLYFNAKIKKLEKKSPEYTELLKKIKKRLDELSQAEKDNCGDIDYLSQIFGSVMSDILSFGLKGNKALIGEAIGKALGTYIYTIDAIDDLERDEKGGTFNPLIQHFGSSKEVKENINAIDASLAMHTKNLVTTFNLINKSPYSAIIENILTMGLSKESYKIMTKNGDKND